jgi:hypothetical protein
MNTPNSQPQSQDHGDNPPANPKARRKGIAGRNQAADLQRFAYDSAMALKETCTRKETGMVTMDVKTAVAVQKLIGAWDIAADRLRILRGKGLPASQKPAKGRGKAKTSTDTEPAPQPSAGQRKPAPTVSEAPADQPKQ